MPNTKSAINRVKRAKKQTLAGGVRYAPMCFTPTRW